MSSISLEAFDGTLRGKLSQWILPNDICALPNGFQDHVLSGTYQTTILLTSKHDSKAWLLSYTWDMTFMPESPTDWSLLLSILQHMKKPILIVSTPKCQVPGAFWQKCQATGVILRDIPPEKSPAHASAPVLSHFVFFPKLDTISDTQFTRIPSMLHPAVQQSLQAVDLRSLYRELRGAGASLCLSLLTGPMPSYVTTWFYPEMNAALRLHVSELRVILRTLTERLESPTYETT